MTHRDRYLVVIHTRKGLFFRRPDYSPTQLTTQSSTVLDTSSICSLILSSLSFHDFWKLDPHSTLAATVLANSDAAQHPPPPQSIVRRGLGGTFAVIWLCFLAGHASGFVIRVTLVQSLNRYVLVWLGPAILPSRITAFSPPSDTQPPPLSSHQLDYSRLRIGASAKKHLENLPDSPSLVSLASFFSSLHCFGSPLLYRLNSSLLSSSSGQAGSCYAFLRSTHV